MDNEPTRSGDADASGEKKRSLPPPSLSKAPAPPPPPAPPAGASSPKEAAGPPLRVGIDRRSSADDPDYERQGASDAPGTDAAMANRVLAAVLDGVVATGLWWAGIIILPDFLHILAFAPALAYLLLRDAIPFLDGQSIGKKAMGLRAVTMEGEPLTSNWQTSALRNVAFAILPFPLVELFVLIRRQEGPKPLLRLGDEWAKTKVINVGRPASGEESGGDETPGRPDGTP